MSSDNAEFQEVLVDIPKHDKHGNPISFDSLSSGGARNADGSLKAQYKNPRSPEPANERASEARERRTAEARRKREDEADERRRQADFERKLLLVDEYLIPFVKNYAMPAARNLWLTKGRPYMDSQVLPACRRAGQRLFRRGVSEQAAADGAAPDYLVKSAGYRGVDDAVEMPYAQDTAEDSQIADVIRMDKYQGRKSA